MTDIQTLQLLTFQLEEQTYAVEIAKVHEVMEFTPVTRIPRSPNFMLGLLNLRGSVVPVVDLRLQFGMTAVEPTIDTSIIILDLTCEGKLHRIGAQVDQVLAVIDVASDNIIETPEMGFLVNRRLIQQVVNVDERHVVILDMDTVLSIQELKLLNRKAEGEICESSDALSFAGGEQSVSLSTGNDESGEAA